MRIFPNRQACLSLVTALTAETSEEWLTCGRYPDTEGLRNPATGRAEARRWSP